MRDLFDPDPHAGLPAVLVEVDGPDPDAAIWARMRHPDSGFGGGGGGGRFVIFGYGVEGCGPSWAEAARQWVLGARAVLEGPQSGSRQGQPDATDTPRSSPHP